MSRERCLIEFALGSKKEKIAVYIPRFVVGALALLFDEVVPADSDEELLHTKMVVSRFPILLSSSTRQMGMHG